MKLNNKELLMIKGGAVNSAIINAIVKGISILIELGRSLGSSIRRASSGQTCEI